MPSSATPRLRLEKQAAGENLNTWGAPKLNTVIDLIDFAIAGYTAIALTGDYALTSANYAADEARSAILKFTGAGGFTVTVPSVSKAYLVWNACGGDLTLTTGAGATVVLASGDKVTVWCDGAGVYEPGYAGFGLKAFITQTALSASGSLPGVLGNAGKYVYTNGAISYWKAPVTSDLSDIAAYTAQRDAFAIVMALIF